MRPEEGAYRFANYHTHTTRCMHAVGTEEEYVRQAIRSGYEILGFADHSAWPYVTGFVSGIRMRIDQLDGYVETVQALKQKYAGQIRIHLAMECEAFPRYFGWLREIREEKGFDYFILGNHYDLTDENNGFYFGRSAAAKDAFRYLEDTVMGMESGLFAYLAHPDLFLHRYPVFDDAARQVCRELCRAAKRLNMPLEYNLLGHKRQAESRSRGCIGYTSPEFWEIAAQEGGRAIIGVDAHDPAHLDCRDLYDQIRARLTGMGIEVLDVLEDVEGK